MEFFFFLFIMYLATKKDKRNSDIFKAIFKLGIALSIISGIFGMSGIPFIFVFGAILLAINKNGKKKEADQARANEQYRQWQAQSGRSSSKTGSYNRTQQKTTYSADSTSFYGNERNKSLILPRAVKKRSRIVENFNKKYNLNLTEDEIKRIVDASYMSDAWKREVEAMTMDYEVESEWFNSVTGWLRVYLYVFRIQTVSSDFPRQLKICDETFDEVMRYAESLEYSSLEEKIEKVNERFFTRFDETTFMIAYRFMEKRGRQYELDKIHILQNENELDEMARKYDQMDREQGERGKKAAGQGANGQL